MIFEKVRVYSLTLEMRMIDEGMMVGRDLRCPKCHRTVARVIDDVYMIVGDLRFYESVRFTCVCHRPLSFRVKDFEIQGFEGETKDILNNLGNGNKFKKQRESKKR